MYVQINVHTVHGVLKARILKWFVIPVSKVFEASLGTKLVEVMGFQLSYFKS